MCSVHFLIIDDDLHQLFIIRSCIIHDVGFLTVA